MPRNLSKKAPPPMTPAKIEAEAKAAEWYDRPEGKRHVARVMRDGIRDGTAKVYPKGLSAKRTDPAVLEALLEKARATMTQAVSLRIPNSDLDAAKAIAGKKGIGYQTVLKNAIRAGLRVAER